jgi:predicted ribosomally synthesized peptide with nif11-like leader
MSEQSALAFAERIKTDAALRASLAAAPDPATRQTIVSEAGYDLSPADAPTLLTALGLDDLSNEELDLIASGADPAYPIDADRVPPIATYVLAAVGL